MAPPIESDTFKLLSVGGSLALLLALLVVAINIHGRRLERHAEWLRLLDLRLQNMHKARERERFRSLQTARPPPLSEARTVEIDEALAHTLKLETKREDEA